MYVRAGVIGTAGEPMEKMNTLIRNIIATRKLHESVLDGKTVLVRIGKPRKISVTEWECAFHISNIGMHEIQFGHGIDGVQALIQAIEGARVFLEKSGKKFIWEGAEEGETGIPRYVPMFYGKDFTEHLHKMIDSEMARFAKAAGRRFAVKAQSETRTGKGAQSKRNRKGKY